MSQNKIEKVERLKNWLESLGCYISPKVHYPFEFQNGLHGMVATDKIHSKEILTEIKQEAIFSTELLQSSPLQTVFSENPDLFSNKNPEAVDNQFLALLLYERDNIEKWGSFFEVFPERIENLSDWTEDELKELQDEDLVEDTSIRKRKNFSTYENLRDVLNRYSELFPRKLGLDEIEWCWKVIWTRSFMRSPDHSALVPFSDLINHGESSTSFYFSDQLEECSEELQDYDEVYSLDSFIRLYPRDLYEISFSACENPDEITFDQAKNVLILADSLQKQKKINKNQDKEKRFADPNASFIVSVGENENYEPGQQILFEYGGYSNTSLLIHYGFALEYNRHEFYRLKLRLRDLLTWQQMKFLPIRYDPNAFILFLINDREINTQLLTALRSTLWDQSLCPKSFFYPTSLLLEEKVLKKYQSIIKKSLSHFKTTIECDKSTTPLSVRHTFSVTLT